MIRVLTASVWDLTSSKNCKYIKKFFQNERRFSAREVLKGPLTLQVSDLWASMHLTPIKSSGRNLTHSWLMQVQPDCAKSDMAVGSCKAVLPRKWTSES